MNTANRKAAPAEPKQQEGAPQDHPCSQLTEGEARYLLAILDLSAEGSQPTQAALARHLGVSNPTTLEMVRRLRQLELLEARSLAHTPPGVSAALVLGARRRAARTLTGDVLGLEDELAAAEATRLAARVSPELGRRLNHWRASHRG
jgi:Mn-dependent DtxR family transcriptional regulator